VFTSITLSQAGMVRHWLREQEPGWRRSAAINGFGAVSTGIVTVIFAVAKFALGAWLIIPILVGAMVFVHRQYERRRLDASVRPEITIGPPRRHQRVDRAGPGADARRGPGADLRTDDVERSHRRPRDRRPRPRRRAPRPVRAPAPGIPFVAIESPYRQLVRPLLRYLEQTASRAEDEVVVLLLPEYVADHWWERFLYNDNARRIRTALLGRRHVLVAEVPYRRDR
jgi:hypothetical protein